ncbi:MAG: hypothetical protein GX300_08455 [Tissierellia bacterium]|nr:hypothetical protein [Tissierellia bacterium]
MIRKSIKLIFLALALIVLTLGCSQQEALPEVLSKEQSIKEIILSKGDNYNFLKDELYIEYMNKLGQDLVVNKEASPPHYAIGNLDEDNIPELVVFKERDPNNKEDEGSLEVYKFIGDKYSLLDETTMNYDNTNYQIKIGKISESTNGILLSNSVGANSGITYGFVLEDNKLKSIFNESKISLISIYAKNEIKDIDNDGILEFSIFTVDPETEATSIEDSGKMILWYKWNGKDSGDLVKVEREGYSETITEEEVFNQGKSLINENFNEALGFIMENKDLLSKYENVELIKEYINKLGELSFDKSIEVDSLFVKYQEGENFDHLFRKYGLSMEKLNSLEYLNREKTLKDEGELKEDLIENISLGYKLATSEGVYYYLIDYQKFVDLLGDRITNEYKDYLKILALDSNEPYMLDGSLVISMEKLAERILQVESFKFVYPYSDLLPEVKDIYLRYANTYFFGDLHTPNYDEKTFVMREEALQEFQRALENYSYTNFADIIRGFMKDLEDNNNIIDDSVRNKLAEKLN